MVDSPFVECCGRDCQDISLFPHEMIMPMAVQPRFQVMFVQVNLLVIVDTENKLVPGSQQVMVKDDDRFSCRYLRQVILLTSGIRLLLYSRLIDLLLPLV